MALNKTTLRTNLQGLFENPNSDPVVLAGQWKSVMQSYASGLVPPSTTVSTAAATLKTTLQALFAAPGSPAAAAMDAAFLAFGATVAGGQLPTFTGIPPSGPPGFVAGVAPPFPTTNAAAATKWANIIHAWMKTGSATLVAPPNTPTPWT